MKKIIDLIAGSGTNKDEKLLNYIKTKYIVGEYVTNICFIYGQGPNWENHTQISAQELRELVFIKNNRNTIYFFGHFFIDKDRASYLKLFEEMCEKDIQIFKTDQVIEHITDDIEWTNKYCKFLNLEDIK